MLLVLLSLACTTSAAPGAPAAPDPAPLAAPHVEEARPPRSLPSLAEAPDLEILHESSGVLVGRAQHTLFALVSTEGSASRVTTIRREALPLGAYGEAVTIVPRILDRPTGIYAASDPRLRIHVSERSVELQAMTGEDPLPAVRALRAIFADPAPRRPTREERLNAVTTQGPRDPPEALGTRTAAAIGHPASHAWVIESPLPPGELLERLAAALAAGSPPAPVAAELPSPLVNIWQYQGTGRVSVGVLAAPAVAHEALVVRAGHAVVARAVLDIGDRHGAELDKHVEIWSTKFSGSSTTYRLPRERQDAMVAELHQRLLDLRERGFDPAAFRAALDAVCPGADSAPADRILDALRDGASLAPAPDGSPPPAVAPVDCTQLVEQWAAPPPATRFLPDPMNVHVDPRN